MMSPWYTLIHDTINIKNIKEKEKNIRILLSFEPYAYKYTFRYLRPYPDYALTYLPTYTAILLEPLNVVSFSTFLC